MYSNGFVLAVLVDGRTIEENKAGQVRVPIGQEYTLFLKNKNDRNATAIIEIDGENIGEFVVYAGKSIEIKRPVNRDCGFKIVKENTLESATAGKCGKTDGSTGLVQAEWFLEKARKAHVNDYGWAMKRVPWQPYIPTVPYRDHQLEERTLRCFAQNSIQTPSVSYAAPQQPEKVVTVDGEATGQQFQTVYIDTETLSTVTRIVLLGYNEDVEKMETRKEIKSLKARLNELEKKCV